jgi:organic radical activating enzyme
MLAKVQLDFGLDGMPDWIAPELVFSGCNRGLSGHPCPDCHNPWLWNGTVTELGENPLNVLAGRLAEWKLVGMSFDGIVFIGGEPLDQDPDELVRILNLLAQELPGLPLFVYTGYDRVEDFPPAAWKVLAGHVRFLKMGSYRPEVPRKTGSRLASGNQRVYAVADGCLTEEVVF